MRYSKNKTRKMNTIQEIGKILKTTAPNDFESSPSINGIRECSNVFEAKQEHFKPSR